MFSYKMKCIAKEWGVNYMSMRQCTCMKDLRKIGFGLLNIPARYLANLSQEGFVPLVCPLIAFRFFIPHDPIIL